MSIFDPDIKVAKERFIINKNKDDTIIVLAGNPNVGKSTIFNKLTGLNQHTGNWPGKTVTNAQGKYSFEGKNYLLVDVPGTYSLIPHSVDEECASDLICFGGAYVVVIVCDAICLERNLNLVLQTIEVADNVIVCVNLMDEAIKKQITINIKELEKTLGVPVIGTEAKKGTGLSNLMKTINDITNWNNKKIPISYTPPIEQAIATLTPVISEKIAHKELSKWISLKLLENNQEIIRKISEYIGFPLLDDPTISDKLKKARNILETNGLSQSILKDTIASCIVKQAEEICSKTILLEKSNYNEVDRKIDKILTSKWTGIPIMIILLTLVFWLTITGANYPSQLISNLLFGIQDKLIQLLTFLRIPDLIINLLILGIYRVVAWIISVMLPPMAIFFPLFTLLEDLGYLPRIAFNLDNHFKKCNACGKQALTMCMGFGCNAAGIVSCRIIDSPRERLIAIITNNFVPCNGRFPTLIAIISLFFAASASGLWSQLIQVLFLTFIILVGICMTFLISRLLSSTILKGVPSSFTLELPPYRKPQFFRTIVRSVFDKTLSVLGRAVIVAVPAGLIIWLMANMTIGDVSILSHCAMFLDPFAKLIGLDGVILLAFILGFPANEIVIPIIIMAYMSTGSILSLDSLEQLKVLLVNNGWTWATAVCMILFSLMHWPCSSTCLTIKKETQSVKWTAISFLVPTISGVVACFLFTSFIRLFGFI